MKYFLTICTSTFSSIVAEEPSQVGTPHPVPLLDYSFLTLCEGLFCQPTMKEKLNNDRGYYIGV